METPIQLFAAYQLLSPASLVHPRAGKIPALYLKGNGEAVHLFFPKSFIKHLEHQAGFWGLGGREAMPTAIPEQAYILSVCSS